MRQIFILLFLCIFQVLRANSIPELEQCLINRIGSDKIEVLYELKDQDNQELEIRCKVFWANGIQAHQEITNLNFSGDFGFPINPGANKKVTIQTSNPNGFQGEIRIILSAYDRENIDISDILNQINVTRFENDLLTLQGKRNAVTDPAFLQKSRTYLTEQMAAHLPVTELKSTVPQYTCINYESNQWGTDLPGKIQIVDAHYDSYGQSPGADDNGSGTAGVLEILRVLSKYAAKKTVRYLLFDLEESGLVGSNIYLNNQINKKDTVESVFNFEMIGYYTEKENTQDLPTGFNFLFPEAYNQVIANKRKGDFITNVGNTNSKKLIEIFANACKNYVPSLKYISLEVPGTGSMVPDLRRSDHANFWDKNIPALMLTDGANFRNKNYHTPKDSLHYLDLAFASNILKATIASLIEVAGIEHGTSKNFTLSEQTRNDDQIFSQTRLNIYQGKLWIECPAFCESFKLTLINQQGQICIQKIIKEDGSDRKIVDLGHLPGGLYFATLSKGSRTKTIKCLLNH
ncbi:MAG: M28 family peptidase [Saprospiraceae bacterium]|nr:M28 family peptidase [Candidatus Vicinibacter affinis]